MVDFAPGRKKEASLKEMTLEELLEHLENMVVRREKITAIPVSRKKESKEPGPANPELVETIEQIRAIKATILARFSKTL